MTKTLTKSGKAKVVQNVRDQLAKFRKKAEIAFQAPFKPFEQRYMNFASYRTALKRAAEIEDSLEKGMMVNSGTVLLKGKFSDSTGCLRASFEVDHGKVHYDAHDHEIYKLTIRTEPNSKYIRDLDKVDEETVRECVNRYSNTLDIDLRDTVTLRKAKEFFADDYVLKNLPLNSGPGKVASRFVIWHIRAYRKAFYKYYNQAKSLWQGSGFKNARSLLREFKRRGLYKED